MDQDTSKISKSIFTCWLVRLSLCLLLQNLIQYGWSREKILPGGSMLMAQCLSWIFFLVEMGWLFFTWIENAQISNEKSPEIEQWPINWAASYFGHLVWDHLNWFQRSLQELSLTVSQVLHSEVKASQVTLGNLMLIINVKPVEPLSPFQRVPKHSKLFTFMNWYFWWHILPSLKTCVVWALHPSSRFPPAVSHQVGVHCVPNADLKIS